MNNHDVVDFHPWLRERVVTGPLPAEQVVAALVPLIQQVHACHERGMVAPLIGLRSLQVCDDTIFFAGINEATPRFKNDAIIRIEGRTGSGIDITDHGLFDLTGAQPQLQRRIITAPGETPKVPSFMSGYLAWEHALEHHDPLTDVFSLGLILASLALGLDLSEEDDLQRFVHEQDNPFALHPTLHPVLGRCIVRMTALRRSRRAQDLPGIAALLIHHREQEAQAIPIDLDNDDRPQSRRQRIFTRLRERLFDCSRRNRLLYYKPSSRFLNLTHASVPLNLPVDKIRADDVCTWQGSFAEQIIEGEAVNLGRWLRMEEAPYIPTVLDRIRLDERRDRIDYGASQLRLVLVFLRWHDLKATQPQERNERIVSPLLLLPVSIEKRKGVRDSWTLTSEGHEAEVNPVLRHQLRVRYGLDLPESIDLEKVSMGEFHARLQAAIQASEPGVTFEYIKRPRIDIIQQKARARAAQHKRHARMTGRSVRRRNDIDYSYDPDNYAPYGLQLFNARLRPAPFPQALVAGAPMRVRTTPMVAESETESGERKVDSYVLRGENTAYDVNPYAWEFDCCHVVLGNFNYRKMSLVRDYRALQEHDKPSATIDAVFAEQARPVDAQATGDPLSVWTVMRSDPTQTTAVARAHQGSSYVIQGPPGTGKSQVITNLIADQVARGKRVLFVCAKRPALDVVHHRLATCGLDQLCCIIHDSQQDKKPFIHNLKAQYEGWLSSDPELKKHRAARERCVNGLRTAIEPLELYAAAMLSADPDDELALRGILGRLIALAADAPTVPVAVLDSLPGYAVWTKYAEAIRELTEGLSDLHQDPIFAHHPFRFVQRHLLADERPAFVLSNALQKCNEALLAVTNNEQVAVLHTLTLGDWPIIANDAKNYVLLAERRLIHLLNPADPGHNELRKAAAERRVLVEAIEAAAKKTAHWITPIPESDCAAVLAQARVLEISIFRFFRPAWYRLRAIMQQHYKFSAHLVEPTWVSVLTDLQAWYDAKAALVAYDRQIATTWQVDSLDILVHALAELTTAPDGTTAAQTMAARQRMREGVQQGVISTTQLATLSALSSVIQTCTTTTEALLHDWRTCTTTELRERLTAIEQAMPALTRLAASFVTLGTAPEQLWTALCTKEWTVPQLENAILQAAVVRATRRHAHLPRFDAHMLTDAAANVRTLQKELLSLNAALIVAETHARFLEHTQKTAASSSDAQEREQIKRYARGRRELEKEFAKVMRYRSIRDLSDDETGVVIADLKPIWLMSPLSVSDTLSLMDSEFDVVIFDEASQIPLEEAVPALHRAPQTIVVGDQQQLPPTGFFASSDNSDNDDEENEETTGERLDLDHDSFLTQAAINLPGTMLGWHYRSRSESLIAFSNAAFYDGRLLTIPDAAIEKQSAPVQAQAADLELVQQVTSRPVSFIQLPHAPYEKRRNTNEAKKVAELVRGLLQHAPHLNIGVVAFSEAQQDEIEKALQALTDEDENFSDAYEAAMMREEDGQFCGLFVKNLENVQGDERDVIILSVCYGPNSKGRMIMNFGPINQSGGEKRLNVVFSRSRRHMVVVSSITADAITNDYNTGANTLKGYLAFAEAASRGAHDVAARTLSAFSKEQDSDNKKIEPLVQALATACAERGWHVKRDIGRSRLRVDLALRKAEHGAYQVGILIDHEKDYGTLSSWDRDVTRPATLSAFGWRIVRVWAMDFVRDPDAVLARIETAAELSAKDKT